MSIVEFKIREKIKLAINRVEQNSSCEIVAVLSKKSYDYSSMALMASAFTAMIVPAFLMLLQITFNAIFIYQMQAIVFVLSFLFLNIDYIARLLLPRVFMNKLSSLKAHESFTALGLHQTHNKQAVMIFVSLFEHYVEIVVDSGVSAKIPKSKWEDIVSKFATEVKNGNFDIGYLDAIESIGGILTLEFPRENDDDTILPNRLIEI